MQASSKVSSQSHQFQQLLWDRVLGLPGALRSCTEREGQSQSQRCSSSRYRDPPPPSHFPLPMLQGLRNTLSQITVTVASTCLPDSWQVHFLEHYSPAALSVPEARFRYLSWTPPGFEALKSSLPPFSPTAHESTAPNPLESTPHSLHPITAEGSSYEGH